MNYNLVAQTTLLFSFVGLIQIFLSKIFILSEISKKIEIREEGNLFEDLRKKLITDNPLRKVDYRNLLMGFLKKIRLFFLRTDDKIFGWTQKLKENEQKEKIEKEGDYWDKIKKNT
jgi:hypothetical protein